jgi:biopolymer transport protein ExbD
MAEMDTSSGGSHKKGPGVKKAVKKSTKVDLTPMVDLGFLLITFFVFTTTMSQATAMAMNEPKDNKDKNNEKEVKASGAMTILLGKGNQVYYYQGLLEADKLSEQFKVSNFKEIRTLITEKKKATPEGDLMYIIKSDDESTFGDAMNIIDEMTICGVAAGHYAEDKISGTEKQLVQKTQETNGIK